MLALHHASRDELIHLIQAQFAALADRDRRLAGREAEAAGRQAANVQLTVRLGEALGATDPPGGAPGSAGEMPTPRGMPGLKPANSGERPARTRRRRAHGSARRRMTPTQRVVHPLGHGPDGGVPLAGGTVKRSREVIELPMAPVVVTAHLHRERRGPVCTRRWVPAPEVDGVIVGQSRLGIGLVSLIAVLREEARLPFATIQRLLRSVPGVELRVGALVGAVTQVATRAAPVVAGIRTAIRASPVVHADETGWREDGRNGYAWTRSTPTHRYFVRGAREKAAVEAALGNDFAGVLVSDFSVASTNYDGQRQSCWAHLLRDLHDLVLRHPRDAGGRGWADAIGALFGRARVWSSDDPSERRRAQQAFQAEVRGLCTPYLPGTATAEPGLDAAPAAATPQRLLAQRMERHLSDRFVFVADPAVPPTTNAAERSLRHLVVSRKISGGSRSQAGSPVTMALATVFGAWRVQGRNPFTACRLLLSSPQV
jgi:transposase